MPWLEFNRKGWDYAARLSPRLFTSHLTPHLMPKGLQDKRAKIIYVQRNVKDSCVSFYHITYALKFMENPKSFNDYLEDFLKGNVGGSSWFDHIRMWHLARDQYNILFLSYEDMILDLRKAVAEVCSFLELNLSDSQINEVVQKSTFESMTKNPKANYDFIIKDQLSGVFMRKGRVGDWKNTFTVAQSERVDRLLEESLGDMNLKFIWE